MGTRDRPFNNSKPNKYKAIKTTVDGIEFHSKKEAKRYSELKILQQGGAITDLVTQPVYPCKVNGHVVCTYIADFRYWDRLTGTTVVEDTKGMRTDVYKLKKRLVEAIYSITITET